MHVGDATLPVTELFGQPVDVAFTLHHVDRVLDAVRTAGLVDIEWYHRGPYLDLEAQTERLYVLARHPS